MMRHANLFISAVKKISNPDLQDTLFFVYDKNVVDGQCLVIDADNMGDAAVNNELLCMNCPRRLTTVVRSTQKATFNLSELVHRMVYPLPSLKPPVNSKQFSFPFTSFFT